MSKLIDTAGITALWNKIKEVFVAKEDAKDLTVKAARDVLPSSPLTNTASWVRRFTAETGEGSSVADGTATLDHIKGFTVKNLVANGNFENGLEGWRGNAVGSSVLYDTGEQIRVSITSAKNSGISRTDMSYVAGHKYYFSCRCKSDKGVLFGIDEPFQYKINVNGKWAVIAAIGIPILPDNHFLHILTSSSNTELADFYIDKSYGIRLYDLTELGLDGILTTVEQCEAFFSQYTDGVEGSTVHSLASQGANLFDKATMVMAGKGIDEDGQVVDAAGKTVLAIPVLKSVVGTGRNNGYRIHGVVAEKVGWNPYPVTNGCFDRVYDIAAPNTDNADYAANTMDGYLYIQVNGSAPLDDVTVHPRWSYSDTQFDGEWYARHSRYFRREIETPTRYLDNGVAKEIGALHGLTNGTDWYRDEIDFTNRKYIKRVGFYTSGDAEYNATDAYANLHVLATPEVYDLADSIVEASYPVHDFGTEALDVDGATPQATVLYTDNYKDFIRSTKVKSDNEGGLVSRKELDRSVGGIDLSGYVTHEALANTAEFLVTFADGSTMSFETYTNGVPVETPAY